LSANISSASKILQSKNILKNSYTKCVASYSGQAVYETFEANCGHDKV